MPRILKTLETIALKFTGGTPASGKVITGDGAGNASWNYVSNTNVASNAEIAVSKLETGSPNQVIRAGSSGAPEFGYMAIDVPIGTVVPYMFPNAPIGFLVCDGSVISRTGYADLFALANSAGLIGTVFGAGDGISTFSLPDMRGRTVVGVGTNADVSTLGANDNIAVSSRTPKHTHTVPSHTHTIPAHHHGMGTGADLNVTSSGSHTHTASDSGHSHNGDYGFAAQSGSSMFSPATAGTGTSYAITRTGYANITVNSTNSNHTHPSGNFSGRIGLVTGGADGNASMTSGGAALTSDVTTVPYIALNYIIKATYSTLLGDSNAEANEAFTVFMGG